MREGIKALKGDDARAFCTRLWFELTIVGRAIWSDESLDQATQLNALKWLNEIQHGVWERTQARRETHSSACSIR